MIATVNSVHQDLRIGLWDTRRQTTISTKKNTSIDSHRLRYLSIKVASITCEQEAMTKPEASHITMPIPIRPPLESTAASQLILNKPGSGIDLTVVRFEPKPLPKKSN